MSSHFEPARKCALLARMTDDELRDFLRFTEFKGIRQFFELVKQGEHGDSMFIVLTGEVRVRLMIEEKERILTTFPDGEFFGEMTLQKWIARGDLQLILLGTYQTRPLPRDRHRVWWGWIGLEQWICDADTNTECHAEPGCAFFRIPAEGLERMRSLTPTLMAKFLWSIAQGLARRIRNDNKRFRDRTGRGWAPDDGDDDDDY